MATRLDEIDETVSDHDARLQSMETAINKLQKENTFLRTKTNDLEGRLRRNNVKFVGIPEGEEKGNPTDFVSALIPKLLGEAHFSKPVIIDRAHRSLQPKPAEGASGPSARPLTVITRVHHNATVSQIRRTQGLHIPRLYCPVALGQHMRGGTRLRLGTFLWGGRWGLFVLFHVVRSCQNKCVCLLIFAFVCLGLYLFFHSRSLRVGA